MLLLLFFSLSVATRADESESNLSQSPEIALTKETEATETPSTPPGNYRWCWVYTYDDAGNCISVSYQKVYDHPIIEDPVL